jgi:apolipoprotein N-acyltransferase
MSWLASIANWAWEMGFAWRTVRGGLALHAGLLIVVLLLGGLRVVFFPPQTTTVRVAGISPCHAVSATMDAQFNDGIASAIFSGAGTPARTTGSDHAARGHRDGAAASPLDDCGA